MPNRANIFFRPGVAQGLLVVEHTVALAENVSKTRERLCELSDLADDIERHLHVASPAARDEWVVFKSLWRPSNDPRERSVALSDDSMELIRAKCLRFRDILCGLEPARGETRGSSPERRPHGTVSVATADPPTEPPPAS